MLVKTDNKLYGKIKYGQYYLINFIYFMGECFESLRHEVCSVFDVEEGLKPSAYLFTKKEKLTIGNKILIGN